MADSCECGNEPLASINFEEFLEKLRTGWFLKKDSLVFDVSNESVASILKGQIN